MTIEGQYDRWEALSREEHEIARHLANAEQLKAFFPETDPDSHKGRNGQVMIIGGSPLFHGAGKLAAIAASQITLGFASRVNDMVFFCSTPDNLRPAQEALETFIGVTRDQAAEYLARVDAVLVGPGLMREQDKFRPDTAGEPEVTLNLTRLALASGKRVVLDAGSLQVISASELKHKSSVIITPHRGEMRRLFGGEDADYLLKHQATFTEVCRIAERIQAIAGEYGITILLKGPIDIIAHRDGWYFSPGGNAGMTKGGTGDVLAGVVTALYARKDNPLGAAASGSFLTKRASDNLAPDWGLFYNATDLANELATTLHKIVD